MRSIILLAIILLLVSPAAFPQQTPSSGVEDPATAEELEEHQRALERELRENEERMEQMRREEGEHAAADLRSWRKDLDRLMREVGRDLDRVPEQLGGHARELYASMKELVEAIDERLAVHGETAREVIDAAEEKIRELEGRFHKAQVERDQSAALFEIRERAAALGAAQTAAPLIEELERSFEESRRVDEEMAELDRVTMTLGRTQEALFMRIEARLMEAEAAQLERGRKQ